MEEKNISDILIKIGVEVNRDNERNTKFKYFPKISILGDWDICDTYGKKCDRQEG